MRALAFAALMALSACGSKEKAKEPDAASSSSGGPHLGDVALDQPLRATDNALTWSLEVTPGAITMTRFAGHQSEGSVAQYAPVAPKLSDDKAVWATMDEARTPVTITFANTRCTESGDPAIDRPLTAEVKIGETRLHGCAGARPADGLNTQPLAGPGNAVGDAVENTR